MICFKVVFFLFSPSTVTAFQLFYFETFDRKCARIPYYLTPGQVTMDELVT